MIALAGTAPIALGCGSVRSRLTGAPAVRDGDGDDDSRAGAADPDNDFSPTYGPMAGPQDRRAIVALLARAYAAAAVRDGAQMCRLLFRITAERLVEDHELHGRPGALATTCARVVAAQLARSHRQLAAERAALKVTIIETLRNEAWVVLDFGPGREQIATLHRQAGTWKLTALPPFAVR